MNADIRLSVEFLDHPKTVKLQRRLGLEAVFCLLRLWTWAAQNRSDGVLQNMDAESIEIAARWNGEENAFLNALVALSFVDEKDSEYRLHNWSVHQEYAANEQARIEKAKKAAAARWGNKQELPESEMGIAKNDSGLCSNDATSMPLASSSNAPNQTKLRIRKEEEEKNPPYPPLGGNGCEGECASPAERHVEAQADSRLEPQPQPQPQPDRQTRRKKGESLDAVQSAIAECSGGNVELAAAFENFRVMREQMRKPLTVAAVRLTGGELANIAGNDVGQKIAILNQSVQRSWQGVFALKPNSRASPGFAQGQPRATTVAQQRSQERDIMAKMLLEAENGDNFGQHAGLAGETFAALPASGAYPG